MSAKPLYRHRATGAFTLIELLIVIAIIAILALIAVPNFLEAQTRAKVTRCYSDMRTIAHAMENYFLDNGAYPPDWDSSGNPNPPPGLTGRDEGMTYANLTTPISYLVTIPPDPFYEKSGLLNTYKGTPYFQYAAPTWGAPPVAWARVGAQYVFSTVGPDQQDDSLWSHAYTRPEGVLRAYNPTNGTISRGDIARSNIGFVPE